MERLRHRRARNFIKLAHGYDAGMHTHTNDVWIVVIKGAYLYKGGAGEKRVGALFYEEGSAKFELIPAK